MWTLFCLFFAFFFVAENVGLHVKGGVNLAQSKSNLRYAKACLRQLYRPRHTYWSVQLRPLSVSHHSLSSVTSLSWERMPTAGWWLHVMLCDWRVCPWCAVVPLIHKHELLFVSWSTAGFHLLFLSSFISGLCCFVHSSIFCLVLTLVSFLSLSKKKEFICFRRAALIILIVSVSVTLTKRLTSSLVSLAV